MRFTGSTQSLALSSPSLFTDMGANGTAFTWALNLNKHPHFQAAVCLNTLF
jgi:hypothetical protein